MRWGPAEGGSISKKDTLITVAVGSVVSRVLLRKWDLIVATGARSERNREGVTLVAVL